METRQLPIGIDNFKEIVNGKYYYVDKTGLISDLLGNMGKVNLFTRPRRFGKSLNMSMLKCFFEIGTDKTIFDGLTITKDKELCEKYMGKYPVVFVSLKDVSGDTFESAYNQLRNIICKEALRLEVLSNSFKISEEELISYRKITKQQDDVTDIKNSLEMFCRLLEKHYGQKVILLIDEYDVPLEKANLKGYYSQMIEVIRTLYSSSLKSNDSLFFAVLTGCLRVSKESIFTGLNNIVVHSISDERFDEYFGFTNEEVHDILNYYDLESHYNEIHEWYDGYRFGDQEIYCPWDVIHHCYVLRKTPNSEPEAYWLNSSENAAVRKLINLAKDSTTKKEIETLISGEAITKKINEQLTHNEIYNNINNIWSMLYMTGYLTTTKTPSSGIYTLCIPNKEIKQIFKDNVLEWFNEKTKKEANQLTTLFDAFKKGDTDTINEKLNKQLISSISYFDEKESFYHGFLLGILTTNSDWTAKSNDESGDGRPDIVVEQEDGQYGFVIELKYAKSLKKLDEACEIAMKQIEDKHYTADFEEYGIDNIFAYAIAFCGKRCKVVGKKVN